MHRRQVWFKHALKNTLLPVITVPTLLIVGGADGPVVELNRSAMDQMTRATVRLEIIPGATHLFPEPGALERVADLAADWFREYLPKG